MPTTTTIAKLSSLLVVALACGDVSGPPAGLPHAAAMLGCGPGDGPAVGIMLAREPIQLGQPQYPFLEVMILEPLENLAGKTWRLNSSNQAAWAWYATGPTQFENVSLGRVTIDRVGPDTTVEGDLDVRFPSGRIAGTFRAVWIERTGVTLCG